MIVCPNCGSMGGRFERLWGALWAHSCGARFELTWDVYGQSKYRVVRFVPAAWL